MIGPRDLVIDPGQRRNSALRRPAADEHSLSAQARRHIRELGWERYPVRIGGKPDDRRDRLVGVAPRSHPGDFEDDLEPSHPICDAPVQMKDTYSAIIWNR